MALVFYASEVLACLPALVKRDLNSYMREAFQDPFKPRGPKHHHKIALSFNSYCDQQAACLLMSGDQASETFKFSLSLCQKMDPPNGRVFLGPSKQRIASTEGHILPFFKEDDVVPILTRPLPSGKVLAISRAEIFAPDSTFYKAPAPTMAAVAIFRALQAISHAHDYKYTCPTEALNALLALPVRDPVAPAQRVSCLVR